MLSHIDSEKRPTMVDVGDKAVTARLALAQALIHLPAVVAAELRDKDIHSKKGPVIHTAIIAGVMGAKRTSDLIPLCHPLALDDVKFEVELQAPASDGSVVLELRCRVKTTGRTGVEMEALTGVSVAALTIYDMTKALSHDIVVREIRLLEKTGGKSDFTAKP